MDGLKKTFNESDSQFEFSFEKLFAPLTTKKAIIWIIIVGLIVYFNILFNGFVSDDADQIVTSVPVHSLLNILLFFVSPGTFNTGGAGLLSGDYYKPIFLTYLSTIYTLFGPQAFFFHFFQMILHIANACLVFILFKKFFTKYLSLFIALVFLVHPLNQEAVAFISDSQDILFFFFGMLALLFTMKGINTIKQAFIVGLLLFCSLLSKETGLLFAVLILFYQFLFRKKTKNTLSTTIIVISLSVLFLLIHFSIIASSGFIRSSIVLPPIMNATFSQRFMTIPSEAFYYIKSVFIPFDLTSNQQWVLTTIDFWHFFFPLISDLLFFFLIGWLGFYFYMKSKNLFAIYFFFLVWFCIGLAFHLNIYPLDATIADRWFYFPFVGLLGIIALGIQSVKFTFNKKLVAIMAGILLFFLSLLTIRENTYWINDLTFYSHYSQVMDNFILENNLGNSFIENGEYDKALIHLEKSVNEKPYWSNLYNLGYAYFKKRNYDKAKYFFIKSLTYGDYYLSHENLSYVLLLEGDVKGARNYAQTGLKKFPYNAGLWFFYGLAEYKMGNKEIAIQAIQHSLQLDSTHPGRNVVLTEILTNQKVEFNR